MPKLADEPLEAIQLRLYKKDLVKLRKLYAGQFGVNRVIRNIVRSFVTHIEAKANLAIDKAEAHTTATTLANAETLLEE